MLHYLKRRCILTALRAPHGTLRRR